MRSSPRIRNKSAIPRFAYHSFGLVVELAVKRVVDEADSLSCSGLTGCCALAVEAIRGRCYLRQQSFRHRMATYGRTNRF